MLVSWHTCEQVDGTLIAQLIALQVQMGNDRVKLVYNCKTIQNAPVGNHILGQIESFEMFYLWDRPIAELN